MIRSIIKALEQKIAELLDKLKINSPLAYMAVVILIFGSTAFIEHSPDLAGKFPWLFEGYVIDILKGLAAALLAPRTKRHMEHHEDGEANTMNVDYDD